MESEKIIGELSYKAVRSSGAGGQNVNKVSSKVVVSFDLKNSTALTAVEKEWLLEKLKFRLTADGLLILNCDEDRSQHKNREIVTRRLVKLLQHALVVPKKRKPTKIPRSVIEKRIKEKRNQSEIKKYRKKPDV